MSSIRRADNGYYFLDLRLEDGSRVRESLKTKDRSVAKIKAQTLISELTNQPRYERTRFEDFVKEFKQWAIPRRSHGTILNYESIIKRLSEEIKVKYLDEITPEKANKFITSLLEQGKRVQTKKKDKKIVPMSGRGVNYYIRTLRAIFNVAKNDFKCIASNPFESVQKIKEAAIRPRRLSKEEIVSFFDAFQTQIPEYYPLFLFYLVTGMRRSEALSLAWGDIDFEASSIIVHGKGDKYRIVPMLPIAKEILLQRRHLEKPFSWDGSTVSHQFVKIRKRLGITNVKLHDLRKTFGTLLADQGISDFFIQQWLGHSDSKVTKMYYIGSHDESTNKLLTNFQNMVEKSLPKFCPKVEKSLTETHGA